MLSVNFINIFLFIPFSWLFCIRYKNWNIPISISFWYTKSNDSSFVVDDNYVWFNIPSTSAVATADAITLIPPPTTAIYEVNQTLGLDQSKIPDLQVMLVMVIYFAHECTLYRLEYKTTVLRWIVQRIDGSHNW